MKLLVVTAFGAAAGAAAAAAAAASSVVYQHAAHATSNAMRASVAPALGGLDVIECAASNGTQPCSAVGSHEWGTNYTSMDKQGNARFTTEFRFVSEDNMIAFENAPFTYAPKYGGFCPVGLTNRTWSAKRLGPSVDARSGWRVLNDPETGLPELYLFSSDAAAEQFIAGLPGTKQLADKLWHSWFGDHGSLPPYGQHGGPFNTVCLEGNGRDCSVDPQPMP